MMRTIGQIDARQIEAQDIACWGLYNGIERDGRRAGEYLNAIDIEACGKGIEEMDVLSGGIGIVLKLYGILERSARGNRSGGAYGLGIGIEGASDGIYLYDGIIGRIDIAYGRRYVEAGMDGIAGRE
jgi:hypothetical protein